MAHKLQQFAQRHAERAWNLACSLAGNAADADDAMQQAFIVASSKLGTVQGDAWPWFAAVVANCARNTRRKRGRHAHEGISDMHHDPRAQDPLEHAAQAELLAHLRVEVAALPDDEREALSLTQLAGLTFGQASDALGVPTSTLSDRVQSGLNRLRSRMNKPEPQIARCLPLLVFPLPSGNLQGAIKSWLAGAYGAPAVFATGAAIMSAKQTSLVVALVIGALVLAWQAPAWLQTPVPPKSPCSQQSNDIAQANRVKAPERDAAGNPGGLPVTGSREEPSASREEPKDAPKANASDVTIVRGFCRQAHTVDGKLILDQVPITDATVWVQFDRIDELPESARKRVRALSRSSLLTKSGPDGAFRFEGIPVGASILVGMAHPDYYCALNAPGTPGGFREESHWPDFPASELAADKVTMTRETRKSRVASASLRIFTSGAPEVLADLHAERGCWFHGSVTSPNGELQRGVTVQASTEEFMAELSTLTGADGMYRVGPFRAGGEAQFSVMHEGACRYYGENVPVPGQALARLDIVLTGGVGKARVRFVALEPRNLDELTALVIHKTLLPRQKKLDATGAVEFTDLDTDTDWAVTIQDEDGVDLVQVAMIRPSSDGVDVELREIPPVRWRITVSSAAFASADDAFVVLRVPLEAKRGCIRDTLADVLRDRKMGYTRRLDDKGLGKLFKHTSQSGAESFSDRKARQTLAVAVPARLLENNQAIALSNEQLARCWISDAVTPELGKQFDLACTRPLCGLLVRGIVTDRKKGLIIAANATSKNVTSAKVGDDGCFELPRLWPGEYTLQWYPDPNSEPGKGQTTTKGEDGESLSVQLTASNG